MSVAQKIKINFGKNSNEQESTNSDSYVEKDKKPLQNSRNFKTIIILIILFLFLSLFFIIKFKDSSFFLKIFEKNIIKTVNQNQTQQKNFNQEKTFGGNNIVKLEPFSKIKLEKSRGFKFVNIDIALELITIDTIIKKNKKQRIRHTIENELGKITWEALKTPEGKLKLKYALIKKINLVLSKAKIKNLYFINLIMQ
ncbi:MAG: hypothetical protein B6I26_02130 [Desulfobacteraceae bacterium 4572_130]|nr:MAG: hypothetical protein B6I26_02130 [Desulfobacteraceae bacterium 4572_130]